MNSTESSTEDPIQNAVVDHLTKSKKLDLGLQALAVDSIRRGLNWEHGMVEGRTEPGDDDSMMVMGDVNVNQPPKGDDELIKKLAAIVGTGAKASGVSPWVTVAIAGLALLSGLLGPTLLSDWTDTDTDTQNAVEFGEPVNNP